MTTYQQHLTEQREYQALCEKARSMGIPTSLDDPRSPRTVDGLRRMVDDLEIGMCPVCSSDNISQTAGGFVCHDCKEA